MSTDDVWKSPSTDTAPADPLAGGSDDPMDVPRAVWADLSSHPGPYLLANVGYMFVAMAFTTVLIAVMAGSIAPGIVMEDDTVLTIGMVVGFAVYFLGIFGLAFVLVPLWNASMMRALDAQRRGDRTIGFTSSFNDVGRRAGSVIGTYALTQLLAIVGMFFFYVPGLMAMAIGSFALPIAVFEEVGPIQAWQLAWSHAKDHAAWHIGVFVLLFVSVIVLEITIVGLFFLWPLMCAWQLYAYRSAFGEKGALGG